MCKCRERDAAPRRQPSKRSARADRARSVCRCRAPQSLVSPLVAAASTMDACSLLAAVGLLLATIALLYNTWPAFRYHARFTAFTVLCLLAAGLPIPLMLRRPRDPKNALFPARWAVKVSHMLGLNWEVRGLKDSMPNIGCVVLINHQSAIDLFVLAQLWPRLDSCAVVAKKEVLFLGPFGLAAWLWGTIFIDRLNPEKARSTVDKTSRAIQEGKMKLLMFPEGTRHNGHEFLPFKKGAFHVAIAAQAPILPVVVSRYHFLDSKTKKFDKGNIVLSVLPPVETKGMGKEDVEQLLEDTRSAMQAEHRRISLEAKAKDLASPFNKLHSH